MEDITSFGVLSSMALQLRKRENRDSKKSARSFYVYRNWTWESGAREARIIRPKRPSEADLINSCYTNISTGTQTLYSIVWDLDAKRADPERLDAEGALKAGELLSFLQEKYPYIHQHIFACVKSTGGKGLALALAVTPFELVFDTRRAQYLAKLLQFSILTILQREGWGADAGALGLVRDFCNWRNPARLLYLNELALRQAQAEKNRARSIIGDILAELKPYNYVKKSFEDGYLYIKSSIVERKLAPLFLHLYAKLENGEEPHSCLKTSELRALTGLSKGTIEKKIKGIESPWLVVQYINKIEGYRVFLKEEVFCTRLGKKFLKRAQNLAEGCASKNIQRSSFVFSDDLETPDEVLDGGRNSWITRATLLLKHSGIEEDRALGIIERHVSKIEGHESSRNCRKVERIVSHLYEHLPNLFSIRPNSAPAWLIEDAPIVRKEAPKMLGENGTREKNKVLYEGGTPGRVSEVSFPSPSSPICKKAKVIFEGAVSYKKCLYSVPLEYRGKRLSILEDKGHIEIFHEGKFVFRHLYTPGLVKKEFMAKEHVVPFAGTFDEAFLRRFIRNEFFTENLKCFAENLLRRHERSAFRRFQWLKSLVKKYGVGLVSEHALNKNSFGSLVLSLRETGEKLV